MSDLVQIVTPLAEHPLFCRFYTSDPPTFAQIFIEREYETLDNLTGVSLIVDCGANVGYSSAYFLSRFPRARVVAIEPEPGNFAVLLDNLAPYGPRAMAVRAGVWSHPCRLAMSPTRYRDGREWARQVQEVDPETPDSIDGIDIGAVLEMVGEDRISILKMDIEGAEGVVFSANYERWLGKVDTIAVELHDDSSFGHCSAIFHEAIAGEDYVVSGSGELTICRRPAVVSA